MLLGDAARQLIDSIIFLAVAFGWLELYSLRSSKWRTLFPQRSDVELRALCERRHS